MNSTKRLAGALVIASATAFSVTAYSQTGISTLDRALSALSREHHDRDRDRDSQYPKSPVVGMWITTLYLGAFGGPQTPKLDIAIQQFSSDGNEFMSSALFSPGSGNVCLGVWKASANNTFKLRHTGWGFDPSTGAFVTINPLDVQLTVSEDGKTFSGTYIAKSFDLTGAELVDLRAEGDVRATRFAVEGPDASLDEVVAGQTLVVKALSAGSSRRKSC